MARKRRRYARQPAPPPEQVIPKAIGKIMRTADTLIDARAYYDCVVRHRWDGSVARYERRLARLQATITRELNRVRKACAAFGLPEGVCAMAYAIRDALFFAVDCGGFPHDKERASVGHYRQLRGALARIELAADAAGVAP